jgi:hypothetical protein
VACQTVVVQEVRLVEAVDEVPCWPIFHLESIEAGQEHNRFTLLKAFKTQKTLHLDN